MLNTSAAKLLPLRCPFLTVGDVGDVVSSTTESTLVSRSWAVPWAGDAAAMTERTEQGWKIS